MLSSLLVVALGGSLGAVSRYSVVVLSQALLGARFPYGTLLVNSMGSFLAGLLMMLVMERLTDSEPWRLFLMVGFLGAYTTFSSFSWETLMMFEQGEQLKAALNVILNNVAALALVFMGVQVGRWIGG
ncbi:fluoride efflux transporter CrcB [Legionella sp. CNM-4043-24]|uniref:fluoride efflux transporter CrcB n=1 Tax=Legionella sp. CNM-4043-24 TaxID=3421646 RepID=UPI00403B03B4